jgi:hypothetical protein
MTAVEVDGGFHGTKNGGLNHRKWMKMVDD